MKNFLRLCLVGVKVKMINLNSTSKFSGSITIPSDKSISHRSAILNSIAYGKAEINNYSNGEDCLSTLNVLKNLGVDIKIDNKEDFLNIKITGNGFDGLSMPSSILDVGNSGTTTRLISGILSTLNFDTTLSGDDSLNSRPMKRIIEPLLKMGANISSDNNMAPLSFHPSKLKGIEFKMNISSAQVKSCIMLAALNSSNKTYIQQPSLSRDHTERMLKGMTVRYLLTQTYNVTNKTKILIHAAAGGVGLIACQWAKHLGATVIGTVGSDEKAAIAKQNGCDYPIVYSKEDFVPIVMDITKGNGVDYVCDGIGEKTFEKSTKTLKKNGVIAIYGSSSGSISSDSLSKLPSECYLIKTTLPGYTSTREKLLANARDVFNIVRSGGINVSINQKYPLKEASLSHINLESRKTTGSSILVI